MGEPKFIITNNQHQKQIQKKSAKYKEIVRDDTGSLLPPSANQSPEPSNELAPKII